MVKVRLETSSHPVGAVEELVWIAVDADADADTENIVVTLVRNDLGGVDRVCVQDDGSGMSREHCEEHFRPIGAS